MSATLVVVGAVGWIAVGVLDAGLVYAHWQRGYPKLAARDRRVDTTVALFFGLLGPLSLPSTIFLGFHRNGWLMPGTVESDEGKA